MIYHPRNDIYHCCFRLIKILYLCNLPSMDLDKLRIIDFYLVFPIFLTNSTYFTFPRGNKISKNIMKKIEKPYEELPNRKILFAELNDFQSYALQVLKSKSIIDIDEENMTARKGENFALASQQFLQNSYFIDDIHKEIIRVLVAIDLLGEKGLKYRSGLMEFRYDAV